MMRSSYLVVALCAGLLAGCQAARFQSALLEMLPQEEGRPQNLLSVMRHHSHGRHRDRDEDKTAYASIKFIVPPSQSNDFEDAWDKLESKVDKEEDVDKFTLSKTKLDNIVYWSYGEWSSMRDLKEHFDSRHFEDFSDFIDDHDIEWELRILDNLSEDIEEEQRDRLKAKPVKKKKSVKTVAGVKSDEEDEDKDAHVLTHYYVPPGEGENFVDAWKECARDTIDEDGNIRYSLRKVATDNTRFWVYGSWESMEDLLDHYESKHLGRLHKYASSKDITWHHEPLELVDDDDDDDEDDDDDRLKKAAQPAETTQKLA